MGGHPSPPLQPWFFVGLPADVTAGFGPCLSPFKWPACVRDGGGQGIGGIKKAFSCENWRYHISNEKKGPSWVILYRGLYGPNYIGMKISHYKDPYKPTRIQWKVIRFFFSWLTWCRKVSPGGFSSWLRRLSRFPTWKLMDLSSTQGDWEGFWGVGEDPQGLGPKHFLGLKSETAVLRWRIVFWLHSPRIAGAVWVYETFPAPLTGPKNILEDEGTAGFTNIAITHVFQGKWSFFQTCKMCKMFIFRGVHQNRKVWCKEVLLVGTSVLLEVPILNMNTTIHGTGVFTYIWLIFMVNVGKYTIHGSYG